MNRYIKHIVFLIFAFILPLLSTAQDEPKLDKGYASRVYEYASIEAKLASDNEKNN